MSASTLMSLGIKAMAANYAALQTTGHNISNANVKGYSRQTVELQTAQGQFTGAGFFGRGVDVATVTRQYDAFLTGEAAAASSIAAMDGKRLEQLRRLENLFKTGEQGLGYAANSFINAMTDLASRPADGATRQVVLSKAGELAARLSDAGAQLDGMQQSAIADLRSAVTEVNSLAKGVASANQRIAELKGLGQPANDLLDERDRLIARMSEHVQVTRVEASDGTVGLFVGGGQRLVLGAQADRLILVQDAADPSRLGVGLKDGDSQRLLAESSLGGGGIAGLLRFQNDDLVAARTEVGRFAAAVGGAVNQQQLRGVNLQQPLGTVATAALFAVGAPQALSHASNARDGAGNLVATVSLTITDHTALQASEYDLRPTEGGLPGQYTLTRLADGVSTAVANGDVVDGFRIDIAPANAAPGDRFLLQPVSRAANGFAKLLDDGRDLAAALPLVADASPANVGTAAVAGFEVSAAPLPVPGARAQISFSNDSGAYTWQLLDSANNVLGSGSGTWQPGQSIPPAGSDINGFSLKLSGVPRNGDSFSVSPTPSAALASNNGNALALLNLRDLAFVGGRSIADAYGETMARVGVRVQAQASASEISNSVSAQAETLRSEKSGVNLDEEAARLIQYQQSYQAAAKVLQVAQSLFDTLIQTAGR